MYLLPDLFSGMQDSEGEAVDAPRLVPMLSTYLRDLLAASRQYSDELLAAALKLLLSAPVSVLPPQVGSTSAQATNTGTLSVIATCQH